MNGPTHHGPMARPIGGGADRRRRIVELAAQDRGACDDGARIVGRIAVVAALGVGTRAGIARRDEHGTIGRHVAGHVRPYGFAIMLIAETIE